MSAVGSEYIKDSASVHESSRTTAIPIIRLSDEVDVAEENYD